MSRSCNFCGDRQTKLIASSLAHACGVKLMLHIQALTVGREKSPVHTVCTIHAQFDNVRQIFKFLLMKIFLLLNH